MNDTVSPFETVPAVEFNLPDLCDIINDAFTGYVGGEVKFTPQILSGFLTNNDVQLNLSRVIIRRDAETDTHERLGIALITRHGWSSRVAMMGIVQSAQGQGVGRALMYALIEQGRERGDKILELEVIEQNPRAIALYEKVGFSIMRRLLGFDGKDVDAQPEASSGEHPVFTPCNIAEAARCLIAYAPEDTPWQLNGYSIVKFAPPSAAFRVDEGEFAGCYITSTNPDHERVTLLSLVVPPEKQRQGIGTRVVSAFVAAHPAKIWRAPSIIPEEYAPVLIANGFTRADISQFQMRMVL